MRHGMRYCMICNPDGNGTRGEPGTEAIGKYCLGRGPSQAASGWIPVCENCAETVKPYHKVTFFDARNRESGTKNRQETCQTCQHDWYKANLVTLEDDEGLYDQWRCEKCGLEKKRRGLTWEIEERA